MASRTLILLLGLLSFIIVATTVSSLPSSSGRIRLGVIRKPSADVPVFREAPAFRNGDSCGAQRIHIVMTLDANYLRGTMAAIFSILQHSTCPENMEFPFSLGTRVRGKISKSIRQSLDQPLNYARIYLADIIPSDVKRVIYLDSDLVVVDDIAKLWEVDLENRVLAAPEYCHANFTYYFSNLFWLDPVLTKTFQGRRPCYFNTGSYGCGFGKVEARTAYTKG
ncbi:hypothetical protein OIU77_013146 [Salix suchowensis]|uniref:Hexosyltransferase n=1 Tax=Salix suchowensis TaxID=1278906 RepID=A0ABQ8ZT44_9ROSI|nr:hypothetical protein OIU77_013146 [Salix suchowensis]